MSISAEEARQQFFKTVEGSYWNPKLSIKSLSNGDRTVVTNKFIRKGEPLVILHPDACFTSYRCIENSKEDLSKINKSLVIPAYLYQFYTGHTLNCPPGYDHYFNALPTYDWYSQNHEFLKLYINLNSEQKEVLKEHFILANQLDDFIEWAKSIPNHEFNWQQAVRSVLAATTRSWSSAGLVPWIDFFNHAYDGSLLEIGANTITASHAYEEHDEVNTSYGFKDSLHLLSVYGYETDIKTVIIKRLPISEFAAASNQEFRKYKDLSEQHPFVFNTDLRTFDRFISHMRLTVLDKYDLLHVTDLTEQYKNWINGDNEMRALKVALKCLDYTHEYLTDVNKAITKALDKVPDAFQKDFKAKFEILDALYKKTNEHWINVLKRKETDI